MIIIISDSSFIRLSFRWSCFTDMASMLINVVDHPNIVRLITRFGFAGISVERIIAGEFLRFRGHIGREPIRVRARKVMAQVKCLARGAPVLSCERSRTKKLTTFPTPILLPLPHSLRVFFSPPYRPYRVPRRGHPPAPRGSNPGEDSERADRNLGAGLANWKIMPMRIRDVFLAKMRDNGISR